MTDAPLPPYELRRSRRRTLSLEITPQLTVLVRAPLRCPEAEVRRFVSAHTDWIGRHMQVQRQRQAAEAARAVGPAEERAMRDL